MRFLRYKKILLTRFPYKGVRFMKFSHMFFEIKISTETFSANFARKRFFFVVSVHMKGKVVDLVECFTTYATFICLFCTVGELMVLIVAFLVKPLKQKQKT